MFWQSKPRVFCVHEFLGFFRFDTNSKTLFHISRCPSSLLLPLLLSSIKAEVSHNRQFLLSHKIISVYLLHVNLPNLPWLLYWRACHSFLFLFFFFNRKNVNRKESNRSRSPMFYSLLLLGLAVFSLISLVFIDHFSREFISISAPPSAGLVIGGWSYGPQGAGTLLGLWGCLRGTLTRQSLQTVSSGYGVTHNPPKHCHLKEKWVLIVVCFIFETFKSIRCKINYSKWLCMQNNWHLTSLQASQNKTCSQPWTVFAGLPFRLYTQAQQPWAKRSTVPCVFLCFFFFSNML